ncbi:TetR/AcrR family transcriptional regulator [Leucobacter luti]|uniref:TetR family transcriptional regulator n=1 Tax=Leucobacter luti TaxID=340320 RepID=A0A4R6RX53_9MICO|nr:TetR/AcrR family transcriptional regulator [Leucobacter luti]MCW2288314.1 AcrR family transcriptional regulator [Leucobacter luti]QYM75738.1 TetR/AcrR family transcriptional regulator [Leucobacter luti]TCK45529.1 TetR family transcriptional regulator [Leucobacter luti]TDP91563.1 TetR family transcriptional regulator [Leucobacter luti]
MSTKPSRAVIAPHSATAAIRRLAERGYEATTAEDLADAVGMSRSTFFRRFGSKDDVVFADHDHALAQLEAFLTSTTDTPGEALVQGTADVLRHLTRDPEAARLRFELMRVTPALRDRELVITHRYERVYRRFIREVAAPEIPRWVAPALAASLVAVHNATLRDWLRGSVPDAPGAVTRDLRRVTGLYAPWLDPAGASSPQRVVVAVYDAAGSPDAILDAVAAQLTHS